MKNNNSVFGILKRLGLSLFITFSVGIITLLLGTFVICKTKDPTGYVKATSIVSLMLTSFIGGSVSSRICDREQLDPFVFSVICGCMFVILLFLLTTLPVSAVESYSDVSRILTYFAVVGIFAVGALIFKPRNKKRLPYKRKIRR